MDASCQANPQNMEKMVQAEADRANAGCQTDMTMGYIVRLRSWRESLCQFVGTVTDMMDHVIAAGDTELFLRGSELVMLLHEL